MRASITKTLLDGLKSNTAPYEIRDTKLPGFLVRVQPSGAVSFVAQLGCAKRVTLGRHPACTLKRARTLALQALNANEGGASTIDVKKLVRPSKSAVTLRTFIDDSYSAWLEKNLKSGAAEASRLTSAFAGQLDTPLSEINAWAIERWRTNRLLAGIKATSVNRDLNTLKACLHRAVEWGVLAAYPLGTIKPMKADMRGIVRFLSNDEEISLRNALEMRKRRMATARASGNVWRAERGRQVMSELVSDHLAPMVILSLNTGMRRGELFQLRWRDVDVKRRLITVTGATTKGGHTRHIPLTDEAFAVLDAWRGSSIDATGLVFPGRTGRQFSSLKTAWAGLLISAEIAGFRWHDLRHTFASKLVQSGVDLNTVRELLGHADIKMTLRYAHLAPAHLADAIGKLKPATPPVKGRKKKHRLGAA